MEAQSRNKRDYFSVRREIGIVVLFPSSHKPVVGICVYVVIMDGNVMFCLSNSILY